VENWRVSIEFSLAAIMALVLYFVAGKNNVVLNVLLLMVLASFCLHPLLATPWIAAATPSSIKAWRIVVVVSIVIIGVMRFGIWVWPEKPVPEVTAKGTPSGSETVAPPPAVGAPEPKKHAVALPRLHEKPNKVIHALAPLTDAERFALKRKLLSVNVIGSDVCIVRIGQKPDMNTIFEQLVDAFEGWSVSAVDIGMVGVAGVNFPDGPYLTGPNINSPVVTQVYSAFNSVGIDLPLVPDSFIGQCKAQVVIVLH
jgi:hypothetical protein